MVSIISIDRSPFGSICKQIEQGVVVQQEVRRIPVLGANNIGALNGITTEEHWLCHRLVAGVLGDLGMAYKVQSHNVVVSLTGVELDGKTPWISRLIRKLSAQGHSREADKDWSSHTLRPQEMRLQD